MAAPRGSLCGLASACRRTLRPWRGSLSFHQGLHLVDGAEQLGYLLYFNVGRLPRLAHNVDGRGVIDADLLPGSVIVLHLGGQLTVGIDKGGQGDMVLSGES